MRSRLRRPAMRVHPQAFARRAPGCAPASRIVRRRDPRATHSPPGSERPRRGDRPRHPGGDIRQPRLRPSRSSRMALRGRPGGRQEIEVQRRASDAVDRHGAGADEGIGNAGRVERAADPLEEVQSLFDPRARLGRLPERREARRTSVAVRSSTQRAREYIRMSRLPSSSARSRRSRTDRRAKRSRSSARSFPRRRS